MDACGPFASASRSVRLAAALALTVALGTPDPGHAQIVRDDTVGPAGPLTGPNYTIPHTDGTRAGANLFHSFSRFNLHTGESATFTGPGDLANVISRVTGGERSTIDDLLRSQVGQANVWFLNPAGVLFGPQARLDVPAAFHVSTADEVRLADGARFSASDPAASRLTVAPPEAFGSLRPNPAGIAVQSSQLETQAGQTLSVVGGSPGHGRPDPQHWRASQSGGDGRSWYGADTGRRPLGAGPGGGAAGAGCSGAGIAR